MKTLLIMRHAQAAQGNQGTSDYDRPLTGAGLKAATAIGELLRSRSCIPEVILSSSAVRAVETTRNVVSGGQFEGEVRFLDSLYLAAPGDYIAALSELAADISTAMVVGHNPGIEAFVELLANRGAFMSTAATAHVSLSMDTWEQLKDGAEGTLEDFWNPKDLG